MAEQRSVHLTGNERTFSENSFLVSKTDTKGRITYVNRVFIDVSGYTEKELLGRPHNLIRHPHMPRCVFKLFWDTIASGQEMFAYIVNLCKNGDHYWVFAHVTPSFDSNGNVCGYHSNRRVSDRSVVQTVITPLYKTLREEEARHASSKDGMAAAGALLQDHVRKKGMSYEQYVLALGHPAS